MSMLKDVYVSGRSCVLCLRLFIDLPGFKINGIFVLSFKIFTFFKSHQYKF
jgi:hypothetical protein